MRIRMAFASAFLSTVFVGLVQISASAQEARIRTGHFTFVTFDLPGSAVTAPHGINRWGQIVGEEGEAAFGYLARAFLLEENRVTSIEVPGYARSVATGINNRGQAVGWAFPQPCEVVPIAFCNVHGFLWDEGNVTLIDVPGALATQANGINRRGQIVGFQAVSTGGLSFRSLGFLLDAGTFTDIEVPDASATWANGINNRGQIVGIYTDTTRIAHGFLLEEGTFTSIDVPGAASTEAYGINRRGQIVGLYVGAGSDIHGFVLHRGRFRTIDVPGARDTYAQGINNQGQIVGYYTNEGDFDVHGFVATPCRRVCESDED